LVKSLMQIVKRRLKFQRWITSSSTRFWRNLREMHSKSLQVIQVSSETRKISSSGSQTIFQISFLVYSWSFVNEDWNMVTAFTLKHL
jgi:hypothetical protein